MRLAYCVRAIFPQHGYGGLERSSSALMRHLLTLGVDVALFTRPFPPGQPLRVSGAPGHLSVRTVRYGRLPLRASGIPARLTNYRSFVEEMGRQVGKLAYRRQIDGIYAHGLCAWGVRRAAGWGVPLVANPHGLEEFKTVDSLKRLAYAPFRAWVRAGCRAADRVIATDEAMRGEVVRLLRVDPAKVVVIPNGVDLEEIRGHVSAEAQAQLAAGWPILAKQNGIFKGLSVGRLEANKGFEHLLRALATASASLGNDWAWVFVGEGSLRNRLEELSLQLGMGERVIFAGELSDAELHNLYEMCDLFVHPTLYEGSSLVTLEALAHGLPAVASAVGGIPDKVIDGVTGFLVRGGDEAALAERIVWMAAHPAERTAMGERGKQLVSARFGWRGIAEQTASLFAQLVDERAACRPPEARAGRC